MGSIKVMFILVAMLVVKTTGNDDKMKQRGDPLWEEFPNRGDTTGDLDPTDILNYDPVTRTMRNKKVDMFPNRGDRTGDLDPTDILNYDPVTRTMRNKKVDMTLQEECQTDLVQCRQNLADFHEKMLINAMYDKSDAHDKVGSCKKDLKTCHDDLADCKIGCHINAPVPPADSMESPCKLEQMFFRRFAKRFINLLISENKEDDSPLEAEVRVELSLYSWNKLRQFVQQKGKIKLVDAHDLMADMLISARHDNSSESSSWLERVKGMDLSNIQFYVLLCTLGIVVVVFESRTHASWWKQLCAIMFIMFIISVGWNWIYLYKKELAHKISEMQKLDKDMPANCRPDKMTWWDSIREVFRTQMTFQADPCDVYHEQILVDPIYEVPPTRAIIYTISIMFMEPLKPLGKYIGDFHHELLKGLPYAAWIPALLSIYTILAVIVLVMCYCPSRGRVRRDHVAWERVRFLEDQLRERERERDAIDQRREMIDENPRREAYAAVQQVPLPALNPVRHNRPLRDVSPGWHQRQVCNEYPNDPVAAEKPQVRVRRRQRGSSESDLLQHRQQRQPYVRDLSTRCAQGPPYHGDVSGGDDSSDETDGQRGHRPCAAPLKGASSTSSQVSPSRVGTASVAPHEEFRSKTTDIQGQPIESPNSEIDSMEGHPAARKVAGAKGEAPVRIEVSRGQKARNGQAEPKGDKPRGGASDQRGAAQGTKLEEEVKLKKEEPNSDDVAQTVSASLTPASSTDSEPFVTSAPGCDSPSSVSVIEGDSSPASGGSVDGDSHLQGLGMSLSGSIDVIEPLGALGGEGNQSEDGQESDEFEVLSREQCQTE